MDIVWALIIGAVAGWLAGTLTKGSGFGLLGNMIVGIIGAVIGHFVFGVLGFETTHLIGRIISATVGAIILLFLLAKFAKRK